MPWYAWLVLGVLIGVAVFWAWIVLYFVKDHIGWWSRRLAAGDAGNDERTRD